MSNPPIRYAWCFSHGTRHAFDPEAPWCTATWVWLDGADEAAALADKETRYGDAQFIHQLPDLEWQLAVMELSKQQQETALAEDEEREWERTGRIPCSDCGTTVRTTNLTSLPEHGCTRRQAARREGERQ